MKTEARKSTPELLVEVIDKLLSAMRTPPITLNLSAPEAEALKQHLAFLGYTRKFSGAEVCVAQALLASKKP